MIVHLEPSDTSYYRTMPLKDLAVLWASRLKRLDTFTASNAPQVLIEREELLVENARDAYITRTAQGEVPDA